MKSSENKLAAPAARDERLGTVLSNGLEEMPTGGCLEIEEIAALVDGGVTAGGERREIMLKHLASCHSCREIFLLSADLQEEERGKKIKINKNRVVLFRPLALAASLLIVILSIYVFYKSGEIPKTTEQLVLTKEAVEDAAPAPPPPKPSTVFQKDMKTRQKKEKKLNKKKIQERPARLEMIRKNDAGVSQLEKEREIVKRRTSQMARSQKLEAAPAAVALKKSVTRGRQSRQSYLPGRQLQDLFNEAIQKTRQSKKAFKDAGKKTPEGDNFIGEDIDNISPPDIDYFLSKSQPGTIAYRFFNLAHSGWCDADGLWYGKETAGPTAGTGTGTGRDGKKPLEQWLTLYPQLSGIFREIAGHTIARLKQDRR